MRIDMDNIAIVTLGCRVNQAESETLADKLQSRGYGVSRDPEDAALCVVNSCTVTSEADRKSRKAVARAVRAGVPVIVTGCMVETDPDSLQACKGVQLVGNAAKASLADLIDKWGLRKGSGAREAGVLRSRAVLKVQEGCDGSCAYCIVPAARGRSRSLAICEIDAAIGRAVSRGAAELVLTGVNLGDYGKDSGTSLLALLSDLTTRPEVGRIRLSSLEVEHLQDDLLREVCANPKICKHLHIPLQSGDDDTLAAMGRSYRVSDVKQIVKVLRAKAPSLALTLDIMAGFPGESERHFSHTLATIAELEPAKLHVFPYSPRPGTAAARMPHQVAPGIKKERALRARKLGNELQRRFVRAQVGTRTEVAVLPARREETMAVSDNYVKVLLETRGQSVSGLAWVDIVEARGFLARGEWA